MQTLGSSDKKLHQLQEAKEERKRKRDSYYAKQKAAAQSRYIIHICRAYMLQ